MEQVRASDIAAQRDPGAPPLLRADQGPVAVLTLNRPEARNCLSEDLIAALHAAIAEIGGSDAIRAIVITGAGSAFSSGHDLKELSSHRGDPDRGKAYFAKIMDAQITFETDPQGRITELLFSRSGSVQHVQRIE